jgi:hypothetical protein
VAAAEWDAEAPTEAFLKSLIDAFVYLKGNKPLATVILWCNVFELGLVRKVLAEANCKHIQVLTWYKHNLNQQTGTTASFLPATEVCIVGYFGKPEAAVAYLSMPQDPLQRHNIIIGPRMGKKALDVLGKDINPCEKPAYLAEWILRKVTKPGDTISGFGAGGDLRGALNAGCNVLAIEQDERQFNAVASLLPLFKPRSDLSMVATPKHVAFGLECLETLGPYRKEKVDSEFVCDSCQNSFPGAGLECKGCQARYCLRCSPTKAKPCEGCKPADVGPIAADPVPQNQPEEAPTNDGEIPAAGALDAPAE